MPNTHPKDLEELILASIDSNDTPSLLPEFVDLVRELGKANKPPRFSELARQIRAHYNRADLTPLSDEDADASNEVSYDLRQLRLGKLLPKLEPFVCWLVEEQPEEAAKFCNIARNRLGLSGEKRRYVSKDGLPVVFTHDEFDIYINKVTLESYIFHGKKIDYKISYLEYDPDDFSVKVVMRNGDELDLGARIQWLIRPHWEKLTEIGIIQTHEGDTVDGTLVPIFHKGGRRKIVYEEYETNQRPKDQVFIVRKGAFGRLFRALIHRLFRSK